VQLAKLALLFAEVFVVSLNGDSTLVPMQRVL